MSTTKWNLDPTHSELNFKVKHLVISTVTGSFNSFEASVETSTEDFDGASVSFAGDVSTIDTNNADRDGHLKSGDFFDVEKYPKMTFSNGKLTKKGGDYALVGDLTIKDVTKQVTLKTTYGGTVVDPYGQTKAGFELEGEINRKDFGLTWSAVTEAGNVVVGDKVRILANIQVVKA